MRNTNWRAMQVPRTPVGDRGKQAFIYQNPGQVLPRHLAGGSWTPRRLRRSS